MRNPKAQVIRGVGAGWISFMICDWNITVVSAKITNQLGCTRRGIPRIFKSSQPSPTTSGPRCRHSDGLEGS